MKSNPTFQVFFLLLLFLATPCLLFGDDKEKSETKKKVSETSEIEDSKADEKDTQEDKKESTDEKDNGRKMPESDEEEAEGDTKSTGDNEEKPDPKAEFNKRMKAFESAVKSVVSATELSSGRRTQLQAMAVAAYRESELKPLWSDSVDLGKVNKALVKLLELHQFEEPVLTFSSSSKPADSEDFSVSQDDLLVTLSVAETCMLLKQGPDSVSAWPNWSFGDAPEIGSTSAHWNDITERFGKTAAESGEPQKLAKAFIPQNRIYQQLFKKIQNADPAAEAPELKVTKLVKVGYKFEKAPELAAFLIGEGYLADESEVEEPAAEESTGEKEPEPKTDSESGDDTDGNEVSKEEAEAEAEADADKPKEEEEEVEEKKETGINDGIYTKELAAAVKEFQKMNGLQADGILGPKTAERISNSDEAEAKALLINLHRARRFPDNPGEVFLHANIPSGEVYGFNAGKETLRMRIVFGKNKLGQRTPIFRDEMEQVVFRPYWNLPYSIAVGEGNYSNTAYLSRNGFKVISSSSGRELPLNVNSLAMVRSRKSYIRQEGGTNNALGVVKFLFPNKHSVYFHDTPYKHYFKNSYRAQSHGCVRLQDPEGMANWVLSDDDAWDAGKISSAMKGKRQEVNLEQKIPVYITYFTALPDATKDDKIGFYQDIYNYDRPDAVVDAPGPRTKPIKLTAPEPEEKPKKPRTFFDLFRRSNASKSNSD